MVRASTITATGYYDPELEVFISQDPLGDGQGYVKGNPLSFVDPSGNYALVDDVTFMAGGALLGVGGPAVADIINGKMSSDNAYRAAYIGGLFSGEFLLYSGPVTSEAVGGGVTSISKQILDKQPVDINKVFQNTVVGGFLGTLPGLKIPGITAGRGNYNAIYKQMITKFETGQISKVSASTAQKMFIGRSTDTNMLLGNILGNIDTNKMILPSGPIRISPCLP